MIPEVINICGIPHRVLLTEDRFKDACHFGQIRYANAEIVINREMPEELQEQTLIHEWLHGALFMIGQNGLVEDEILISSLAQAINQTFKIKEKQT